MAPYGLKQLLNSDGTMIFSNVLNKVKNELGINVVANTPRDYKLLVALRLCRCLAFGGVAVVAARYLKLIGFQEDVIGAVFTAIMAGDLIVSFLMSLVADKLGRKNILMISSLILATTSFVFYLTENHVILVITATVGFMTPSGNEVGPFRSIEQSTIAHLVPLEQRSDCYAFYLFLGQLGAAIGSFGSGFMLQILQSEFGFSEKDSDKVTYLMMGIVSVIMIYISFSLTDAIELQRKEELDEDIRLVDDDESLESFEANQVGPSLKERVVTFLKNLAPNVDPESRAIVIKLSILFIIDTTAKSLVTKTWVSYYMKQKFNLQPDQLGSIFFFHDLLVAAATLIGASISRRKGIIFTMIFTHFPSIIFNTAIPIPTHVAPSIFFILGRGAFQAMDISSKHAFVSSVVKPEERTAVIAWTNLCRTLGQTTAPSITGYVTSLNMQWVSFVLSGVLRLLYDIGLFTNFWHIKDSL